MLNRAACALLLCGLTWTAACPVADDVSLTPAQRRLQWVQGAPLPRPAEEQPQLPIPTGNTVADFQVACYAASESFKAFSQQVSCIKRLLAASPNPHHSSSNPDVQLYLLTADKLVDDVKHKRLTPAAARVELQRAYLDIRQRQASEAQEQARIAAERETAQQERARAEEQAREGERAQYAATVQQQAIAEAAEQRCIQLATERQDALSAGNSGQYGMQQGMRNLFGNPAVKNCRDDPDWYLTIPAPKPRPRPAQACVEAQPGVLVCQ
jgi:hypothetical protein